MKDLRSATDEVIQSSETATEPRPASRESGGGGPHRGAPILSRAMRATGAPLRRASEMGWSGWPPMGTWWLD